MNGFFAPDKCAKPYDVKFSLKIKDYLTALDYSTVMIIKWKQENDKIKKKIIKATSRELNWNNF